MCFFILYLEKCARFFRARHFSNVLRNPCLVSNFWHNRITSDKQYFTATVTFRRQQLSRATAGYFEPFRIQNRYSFLLDASLASISNSLILEQIFVFIENINEVIRVYNSLATCNSFLYQPWSLSAAVRANKTDPTAAPSDTCIVFGKFLISGLLSFTSRIVITAVADPLSGCAPLSVARTVRVYESLVSRSNSILVEMVPVLESIENAFVSAPEAKLYDRSELLPTSASI